MHIDGHQRTVFFDVSTFYEAFLRMCASYVIVVMHIIFMLNVLCIIITSWDSQ